MGAVLGAFRRPLAEAGWTVVERMPQGQSYSALELVEAIGAAEAAILGDDDASAEFFEHASDKLAIVLKWGVGVDSIDHGAAASRGVAIRNTPGAFGAEVADLAMGYVIALARRTFEAHQSVANGNWLQPQGQSLQGKTLSLVGFGDIGRQLSKRATSFGMRTVYCDPYCDDSTSSSTPVSIDEAFVEADFLALTCPSTAETRGIVSARALSLMKPQAMLINVARGDLIDESALANALKSKQLGGAALDVFVTEPLPTTSSLRTCDSLIFGSHNASNTTEAIMRASEMVVGELLAWGRGGPL
jgi:D-3-phosphoglycerate dehydrogenase